MLVACGNLTFSAESRTCVAIFVFMARGWMLVFFFFFFFFFAMTGSGLYIVIHPAITYSDTATILREYSGVCICDQRDSDSMTVFGVSSGSHPND